MKHGEDVFDKMCWIDPVSGNDGLKLFLAMFWRTFCICFISFLTVLSRADSGRLDSLKQVVRSSQNDTIRCSALLDISLFLYAGDEAVEYARRALQLARDLKSPHFTGMSYYALAWCHSYDEMELKTGYLDSALQTFGTANDLDGLGLVSNTRAVMFMDYGVYEEAISSFSNAYKYYLDLGDPDRQALILNNWGACLNEMGLPEKALEKYTEALNFEKKQIPIHYLKLGRIYHGIAEANRQMGNLDLAAKFHVLAYQARMETGNIAVAETLINMVKIISQAVRSKYDTSLIMDEFRTLGFSEPLKILDHAANFPGMEGRIDFRNTILDAKRDWYVVNNDFFHAYHLLDSLKRFDEQQKLNPTSLEALADLKIQYEKERLKLNLLETEVENQKKANQVNILLLFLSLVFGASLTGLLWYQNRIRRSKLLLAEARQEQQIISMRSMLEGQEKERSRIARDLHDGLGNLLSSIKANMGSLYIEFNDANTRKIYTKASDMIDEACTEVRKIAHEMMPQALKKLGLINALNDLVNRMNFTHPFTVDFKIYGEERILEDHFNIMIFRIVQEVFNNIIKYAAASEVLLQLTFSDEWLNITVEDNGVGFDLQEIELEKGIGLKSIDFRTNYMGGNYEVDSKVGEGTLISINVPLVSSEI
ncbi:MAG: sensor histidine kinase [Saprospiraceae bacterium]|nr:sensor histidine kinase [Saprospiraceae bacterium]